MYQIRWMWRTTVEAQGGRLTAGELSATRSRQILELLALEPGIAIGKELIAGQLWDGRPPSSCIATLKSYVSVHPLLQVLTDESAGRWTVRSAWPSSRGSGTPSTPTQRSCTRCRDAVVPRVGDLMCAVADLPAGAT
jgi:hypothetical protein